MVHFYIIS